MKIILAALNAKYIHTSLALYSLRAYSRAYGCFGEEEIQIREFTINQQMDEILEDLYREKPDVVCFSCYLWNIERIRKLTRELKKVLPCTAFWAGGPEVSYDAAAFLDKNQAFTGVMRGEGEETFLQLAKRYRVREPFAGEAAEEKGSEGRSDGEAEGQKSKVDLSGIPGLVYRGEKGMVDQGTAVVQKLDRLPFPYMDLSDDRDKILYYESSRGCPFSCSYCLSSVEHGVRFRSLLLVKKELQFFLDQKVSQVKFVDRTFNCNHTHSLGIWQYLLDHDNGSTNFHFELAADLITEEELILMEKMRPGLIQLEIGVQSTNRRTIQEIHRTMDFREVERVVRRIHSFGNIHLHLDLIAGLPFEDYESFHRSFLDVYALHPNQLQLGFLKVLKGSYLARKEEDYHILRKEEGPYEVMATHWLSYEELLRLKQVESLVEVYYNSGQFLSTLAYLELFYSDMFRFFEDLGVFYQERNYVRCSHTRLRRYEILLEFLEEMREKPTSPGLDLEAIKDRMLVDLYRRERLKKEPSFGLGEQQREKEIWEYRRKNRVSRNAVALELRDGRILLFDYERRDPLSKNAEIIDITDEI